MFDTRNPMPGLETLQRYGRHVTPYLKDSALILQLLPTMVESMIGTKILLEASPLITHM